MELNTDTILMTKDKEKEWIVDEGTHLTLDVKTLVGLLTIIITIATVYFTLKGQLAQLQLDTIRMHDAVEMNSEFRVKWPRGELGALPDDAVQDLKIRI